MEGKSSKSGVTALEILVICFIVLKLLHVINWSWIIILCPIWIPLLIVLGITLYVSIVKYMNKNPNQMRKKEVKVFYDIAKKYGLDVDGDTIKVEKAICELKYWPKRTVLGVIKRLGEPMSGTFYINLETFYIKGRF